MFRLSLHLLFAICVVALHGAAWLIAEQPAAPRQIPCVALQNQYAFDPDARPADPTGYFDHGFDLARQAASATDVDYSPDGKFLAATFGRFPQGGWLLVWDLENNQEKFSVWMGHGARRVQFAPDGKTIAVACFDQSAKVFSADNGEQIAILPVINYNGTNSVSFSPDGKTIATGGLHRYVILWDTETYQERLRLAGHDKWITCAMYSPDGKMVASSDASGLGIVWDAVTGKEIVRLEGHKNKIEGIDFTRDSKLVITAGSDRTVRFWDAQTGEEREPLRRKLNGPATCIATSTDGTYVASAGHGDSIELLEIQDDDGFQFPHDFAGEVFGLCFSPDGSELAAADWDGTIKRWDRKTLDVIETIDMKHHQDKDPASPVLATAWSGDGKWIVSGHADGSLRIRNAMTGELGQMLEAHSAEVTAISFSPSAKLLVTCGCDNAVRLWNFAAGKAVKPTELVGHDNWVFSCSFSPDGKWLATGSLDKTVRIWDVQNKTEIRKLDDHSSMVLSLAFSADGKTLISGEDSGSVIRWNTDTWEGSELASGSKFRRARFSPSGDRLALGFQDDDVLLFDTATWKQASTLKETNGLASMAWSPHGRLLAIGGLDGKVKLLEVESKATIKSFHQHAKPVSALAYAPNGSAFVSGSVDGRLLRWNAIVVPDLLLEDYENGGAFQITDVQNAFADSVGNKNSFQDEGDYASVAWAAKWSQVSSFGTTINMEGYHTYQVDVMVEKGQPVERDSNFHFQLNCETDTGYAYVEMWVKQTEIPADGKWYRIQFPVNQMTANSGAGAAKPTDLFAVCGTTCGMTHDESGDAFKFKTANYDNISVSTETVTGIVVKPARARQR